MSFHTNLLKSHTVRQLFGASVGMLVAGGLYVGFEQLSTMQLGAMLVQPNTNISENADQVATAHTELDDETTRRLGQRAQAVSDQLKQYATIVQPVSSAPATAMEQRTQERLVQRQQQLSQFNTNQQVHAAAPVYTTIPGQQVDQLTRLAQRAEQARQEREQTLAANIAAKTPAEPVDLASLIKSVKENPALAADESASNAAAKQVAIAEEQAALHSGAPLAAVVHSPKKLTSSGARENLLMLLALAACVGIAVSDPTRRARFVALLSR